MGGGVSGFGVPGFCAQSLAAAADATSLWSDELYSVGKSFQPDFGALLAMLREDTHPLLYYALLWLCGSLVGQSPISLRLLSRLAYALGAGVMVAQAAALAPRAKRLRAIGLAALLALCSPNHVRSPFKARATPCWC